MGRSWRNSHNPTHQRVALILPCGDTFPRRIEGSFPNNINNQTLSNPIASIFQKRKNSSVGD